MSGHVAVVSRRIERDGMEDGLISVYIYLKLGSDCISFRRFDVEFIEKGTKSLAGIGVASLRVHKNNQGVRDAMAFSSAFKAPGVFCPRHNIRRTVGAFLHELPKRMRCRKTSASTGKIQRCSSLSYE